jgi:hypothetical protein
MIFLILQVPLKQNLEELRSDSLALHTEKMPVARCACWTLRRGKPQWANRKNICQKQKAT